MIFPVSGVECPLWLPPLVAFVVSFFTSMAGVSGAFLLLPFMVSILGFTTPAVSPTNLVFNIMAIPSGVWRFVREGRMVWPLTWVVVLGTLPGVVGGGLIRLEYLPDPGPFKAFAGSILLYIGIGMFYDLYHQKGAAAGRSQASSGAFRVRTLEFSLKRVAFDFGGVRHECSTWGVFFLALGVGVVGGIYGIGGGAIIAPFFVAIYHLPVHAVAGAALMGTFITSLAGVAFYHLMAPLYAHTGLAVAPDWLLGALFGLGGVGGIYCGARMQRFVPGLWLKVLVGVILVLVALRYVGGFLLS